MPLEWKSCLVAAINKRVSTCMYIYIGCVSVKVYIIHTNCEQSKKGTLFVFFFLLLFAVYAIRTFSHSLFLWLKELTNQRLSTHHPSSFVLFSICTHNRQNTGSDIKIVNISLESAFCNRLITHIYSVYTILKWLWY